MKKFLFLLAAGFVFGLAVTSCKSHETCPAYGSADVATEVSEAQS